MVLAGLEQLTAEAAGLDRRIDREHAQIPDGVGFPLDKDAALQSPLRPLAQEQDRRAALQCRSEQPRVGPLTGQQPSLVGPTARRAVAPVGTVDEGHEGWDVGGCGAREGHGVPYHKIDMALSSAR